MAPGERPVPELLSYLEEVLGRDVGGGKPV